MSSHKARLAQFAEVVKKAGLAGQSMQKKLAEIISDNDLTGHEIDRIAEIANRDVQLALYKSASDKRFKFELINPEPLKAEAKKHAQASRTGAPSSAQKVASIIYEEGGDPFAVPYRSSEPLSLFEQPMNMKTAAEMELTEIHKTTLALGQKHAEYELVSREGKAEMLKIAGQADKTFSKSVQAAIDLISTGVTLPSLYTAVAAASGGSRATDEERKSADALMLLIVRGIKERGIPNHRLGFRHRGNIELLDRLSPEELIVLCKQSTGRIYEHDVPMPIVKMADYLKSTHDLVDDLDPHLALRDTDRVAQPYLDDKYVGNTPGGKPLVINGENEFVIGVTDLIGDQSRVVRCHAANEYVGLKLKQIEHTLHELLAAKKGLEGKIADFGTPPPPKPGFATKALNIAAHPLASAAVMAAPFLLPDKKEAVDLGTLGQAAMNVMGAKQVYDQYNPPKPKKLPQDKMSEQLKNSHAKRDMDAECKQAFIPALMAAAEAAAPIANVVGTGLAVHSALSTPSAPKPPPAPKPQVQSV